MELPTREIRTRWKFGKLSAVSSVLVARIGNENVAWKRRLPIVQRPGRTLYDPHAMAQTEENRTSCFQLYSDEAVAKELAVSVRTVHTHFERMYRKLGVHSRCELIAQILDSYVSVQSAKG